MQSWPLIDCSVHAAHIFYIMIANYKHKMGIIYGNEMLKRTALLELLVSLDFLCSIIIFLSANKQLSNCDDEAFLWLALCVSGCFGG